MSKHTEAIREALAAGPTPGPWVSFYKFKYSEWHVGVPLAGQTMKLALFPDGCPTERPGADAEYIAACNPANVAALLAERDELLEACQTFAEWLRREDEGFPDAGERRETPEGEAEWSEWFQGNLRLCDLAQARAIAAIAKAQA